MSKEAKTNAMRFLETKNTAYKAYTYECKEFVDGLETAQILGLDPNRTFKTLVANGKSGAYYVFVLPVGEELDLKKAARAVGEKSVELLAVKQLLPVTGYVRGGCSPLGMKKHFETVIHASASDFETIFVSGGRIGLQLELDPKKLAEIINARFEDVIFR